MPQRPTDLRPLASLDDPEGAWPNPGWLNPDSPRDAGLASMMQLANGTQTGISTSVMIVPGGTAATTARATQAIGAVLAAKAQSVAISSLFKLPTGTTAPTTLILNVLDRIEYTAGFNAKALGTLVGSKSLGFTSAGGDAMTIGAVFTYQPATGRYSNATLGFLDTLKFTTSSNLNDQVSISLYAAGSAGTAASYAANSYVLMSNPASFSYQASVSISTQAASQTIPAQATPGGVAAAALAMVGQAWNDNGCWVLASTIADRAGASLPASSTAIAIQGGSNGEWVQAYNGRVSIDTNWTSRLRIGEIVSFVTTSGGGHITTVVSGSGTSAQLVDNMAIGNASGGFANSAHDGQAADITILAPHAAMGEFAGVDPSTVCVYALDAPMVTAATRLTLAAGATAALASSFSASNPIAGQSITGWQLYDTTTADNLQVGGVAQTAAHALANAFTVASLSTVSIHAASTAGTDTVMARATNGSYWGDWTSLSVTVTAPVAKSVTTHV